MGHEFPALTCMLAVGISRPLSSPIVNDCLLSLTHCLQVPYRYFKISVQLTMFPALISKQIPGLGDDATTMDLEWVAKPADAETINVNNSDEELLANQSHQYRTTSSETETSGMSTPPEDNIEDMICVGFGPAALGTAVALHDRQTSLEQTTTQPRVRFLEKQDAFFWHAGMLLPGAKMQISFVKDLATLRDPRSHFTFLSYLHQHQRLVSFTNLSTFLPSRIEFEDYMRWAAGHFAHQVEYLQAVEVVRPIRLSSKQKFDCLEVVSKDTTTGHLSTRITKKIVIATGGQACKPAVFAKDDARILHTSEYQTRIGHVLPDTAKPYSIAVVGSGQSAAEVFNDLHTKYPNATTRLIMRDTAMRPSDDSPFVNEVFNPEAVDSFYRLPKVNRIEGISKNKSTNYSVVRLELLEHIYENMYMQRIREPDESKWQHQILPSREVTEVASTRHELDLTVRGLNVTASKDDEKLSFDAVILATGYQRDAYLGMLQDCQQIKDASDESWSVNRDYSLKLDRSLVQADVGIWLQGCNEATHGLADSLLSIIATRSGELVQSMFG